MNTQDIIIIELGVMIVADAFVVFDTWKGWGTRHYPSQRKKAR